MRWGGANWGWSGEGEREGGGVGGVSVENIIGGAFGVTTTRTAVGWMHHVVHVECATMGWFPTLSTSAFRATFISKTTMIILRSLL